MAKKKKETAQQKTWMPSKKHLVTILMALTLIIAVCAVVFFLFFQQSEVMFSMNAAIIDQLGESDPSLSNSTFVEKATNILESRNFTVTYYNETLNVDFFKKLAEYNYGILVLRVHSALRENNLTVDLFTSERYVSDKYEWELEHGLLVRGKYLNRPESYFAITSLFIDNLAGRFPKSVIIAMGCWSLKPGCEEMALAFLNKGAKAYVGWNETVAADDTDCETTVFLEKFLSENETLANAIAFTHSHVYYDPFIQKTVTTRMNFCPVPPSIANLTISDLIAEAQNSKALPMFEYFELFSFLIVNINFESKDFSTD